jgi:hypothetical protein
MPQARRLIELRRVFTAVLPESLARWSSIANVKQGKVIVFAANGSVAAKLRLMSPALLEQLSKRGTEVTGLEVRVQPLGPSTQVPEKSAQISVEGTSKLAGLFEQLPDSELKNAVGRLVRRHRP